VPQQAGLRTRRRTGHLRTGVLLRSGGPDTPVQRTGPGSRRGRAVPRLCVHLVPPRRGAGARRPPARAARCDVSLAGADLQPRPSHANVDAHEPPVAARVRRVEAEHVVGAVLLHDALERPREVGRAREGEAARHGGQGAQVGARLDVDGAFGQSRGIDGIHRDVAACGCRHRGMRIRPRDRQRSPAVVTDVEHVEPDALGGLDERLPATRAP
jgi:hypothetical protein